MRHTPRWSLAVLALVLVVQVVTHLAWLPISAHSGQVAIPWMLNQGRVLFGDVLEQHAPGSSLLGAAAQRILPAAEPVQAARLANLALVLAVTAGVWALAGHIGGAAAAALAALVWFWWQPVYGNVLLYFDSLLGAALLGAALLWIALQRRGPGWLAPLLVGLLLGAATLAKQHAWAAIALSGLWLLAFYPRRRLLPFAGGALVFPLLALLVTAAQGTLTNYIYWTWTFNFSGLMPAEPLSGDFMRKLLLTNALVPAFALLALRPGRERRMQLLLLLLWLAGSSTLIPRPGEVHAMGQLPALAALSGLALAALWAQARAWRRGQPLFRWLRSLDAAQAVLLGMLIAGGAGWLWTGAAAYGRGPVATPAHDEFAPIAADLRQLAAPGDTLFVLPQTDSTPQLHPLSGLLPPGTWVKGWRWYLAAPGMLDTLLAEWETNPPTYIVYFPELIAEGLPEIAPLVAFMEAYYAPAAAYADIPFHGPAQLYRLR